MQDLKVRFWHAGIKKMLYPPSPLDSDSCCRDSKGKIMTDYHAYMTWDGRYYIDGKLQEGEFLACTGYCDNNKKDVYEGDIVSWSEYQGWEDGRTFYGRYVVEWNDEELRWDFCDPWENQRTAMGDLSFDEVVGNIYENPELLPSEDDTNEYEPTQLT